MDIEAAQLLICFQPADLLQSITLEVKSLELRELLHALDSVEAYNEDVEVRKKFAKLPSKFSNEVHMSVGNVNLPLKWR